MTKATGFNTSAFQITGGAFDMKELAAEKVVELVRDLYISTAAHPTVVNNHVLQHVEVVHANAELPAELLAQEPLVLDVDALLVARVALRCDRQVERIVADVAAVAQHVACPDRRDVRQFEVVRLRVEQEVDGLPVGADCQQRRRRAVQHVREELRPQRAACVGALHVAGVGALLDPERADAGVDDAIATTKLATTASFRVSPQSPASYVRAVLERACRGENHVEREVAEHDGAGRERRAGECRHPPRIRPLSRSLPPGR